MKKKIVGVAMPIELYEHIKRIAEIESMIGGKKVKVSSLIRTTISNQFKFGQIEFLMRKPITIDLASELTTEKERLAKNERRNQGIKKRIESGKGNNPKVTSPVESN